MLQHMLASTYADVPDTTKQTFDSAGPGFIVGVASMKGWRLKQEDTFDVGELPGGAVLSVFDGHGGDSVAKFCSRYFRPLLAGRRTADALSETFLELDAALVEGEGRRRDGASAASRPSNALTAVLALSLAGACAVAALGRNRRGGLFAAGACVTGAGALLITWWRSSAVRWWVPLGVPEQARLAAIGLDAEECGATAVCALLDAAPGGGGGLAATVANVGDARCIALVGGSVVRLSTEHKPTVREEKRRILLADSPLGSLRGGRINGELDFSRAIGDLKYKRQTELAMHELIVTSVPAMHNATLQVGDLLLLATDGVFDLLRDEELLEFVREQRALAGPIALTSTLCSTLLDRCIGPQRAKPGSDNMTCLVVEVI